MSKDSETSSLCFRIVARHEMVLDKFVLVVFVLKNCSIRDKISDGSNRISCM